MSEDRLNKVALEQEMRNSYIDYAMSVIISRALPDVRDGLKPVHRRILYAMDNLSLSPQAPFKKSAAIVGDVIGKYHPHGDAAVYDALVRLAQNFNLRYPLILGQGNFGSVDGDPAAAYRYTEARLTPFAMELLTDLDKNTVDFSDNFDASLQEPSVLPSRIPNLLINGSSGIAVGMSTNIPPHNLSEVITAAAHLIEHPDADNEDIIQIIKGPDFPGGGIVMGAEGCRDAYRKGRGTVTVRSRMSFEKLKKKEAVIIDEIPYQVNKTKLIEQIADGIKKGKINNISDLRDESDKSGIRIVIELSSNADRNIVVNQLYKHSNLQITFGMIMLALKDGEPKFFTLKDMISCWLDHRKEVTRRRTLFELKRASERAELLETLLRAIDEIDEIIKIIRSSKNRKDAEKGLRKSLNFTEKQAKSVLDMRLESLIALEKLKLEKEFLKLIKEIAILEDTLNNRLRLMSVIKKELLDIKKQYGDDRRTQIIERLPDELDAEDLIPEEKVAISFSKNGFIKRFPVSSSRKQEKRTPFSNGDIIFETTTHGRLMIFTNFGKVYSVKTHEIPETGKNSRGSAVISLVGLSSEEKAIFILPQRQDAANSSVFILTAKGFIKKSPLKPFENPRKAGLKIIKLEEGDEAVYYRFVPDGFKSEFIAVSSLGFGCLCSSEFIKDSASSAKGSKTIPQEGGRISAVIEMALAKEIIVVTKLGFCSRISTNRYRLPSKLGKPVRILKVDESKGDRIVYASLASKDDSIEMLFSSGAVVSMSVKDMETASSRKGSRSEAIMDGDFVESCRLLRQEY